MLVILLVVTVLFMLLLLFDKDVESVMSHFDRPARVQTEAATETVHSAQPQTEAEMTESEAVTEAETEDPDLIRENSIYTFMQGPVAWNSKVPWSGEWCEFELEGGTFSVFGCGLCVLANIYGTLTPYECSPVDMYRYAMKASDYSPSWGYGAIDWPYLEQTLRTLGFRVSSYRKNRSYEAFRRMYRNSMAAIVLVSSESDDTYWQDTPGHYVNPWLYDEETDQIFLGDSGNPKHNRSWVPLRYLYDAMAHDSSYQYLLVHSYDDSRNQWKYSGITEKWTVPSYYTPKPKREEEK